MKKIREKLQNIHIYMKEKQNGKGNEGMAKVVARREEKRKEKVKRKRKEKREGTA